MGIWSFCNWAIVPAFSSKMASFTSAIAAKVQSSRCKNPFAKFGPRPPQPIRPSLILSLAGAARTAAAAIEAGEGETETTEISSGAQSVMRAAEAWLRTHSLPVMSRDYPGQKYDIPSSQCGPLDGLCIQCNQRKLQYTLAMRDRQRALYRKEHDTYTCMLNRVNGREASSCSRMNVSVPGAAQVPPCASKYNPNYVSPAAVVDEEGNIVTDESGPSYYTLLPEDQQREDMRMTTTTYAGRDNAVAPPPASGPGEQPGVVESGGVFNRLTEQFQQVIAPDGGGGEGGFPWLLAAVAAGGIYLITKKD